MCQNDESLSYWHNGKNWDGNDCTTKSLLDANNYTDDSGTIPALQRGVRKIAERDTLEGKDAIVQADGVRVEWRVASKEAADISRQLFKTWAIDVKIVYVPQGAPAILEDEDM